MPALTPAQRAECIEKIRTLPAQLAEAVAGLSAETLTTAYLSGEWTVAQNVHHLADAHVAAIFRVKQILAEERPALLNMDPDRWAAFPDASAADLSASLAVLGGLHARWAMLLESLSEEQWRRVGAHPKRGDLTVDDLVRIYSGHGAAHLDQIARTLAARG